MQQQFKRLFYVADQGDLKELQSQIKQLSKTEIENFLLLHDDDMAQTIFHVAATAGHNEIMEYLLSITENLPTNCINEQDRQGWTPLHCACHSGNLHIAKMLLENPCIRPLIVTNNKSTALHYIGGYEKRLQIQREEDNKRSSGNRRFTQSGMRNWISKLDLLWTKQKLQSVANEVADLLIEKGVGVNQLNAYMESPIQTACLYGYKETVELLLTKGAYVFGLNAYEQKQNFTEIVEILQGFEQLFTIWLADEILLEIFKHLSAVDLINVSQVCKLFNRVAEDNILWKRHIPSKSYCTTNTNNNNNSYKAQWLSVKRMEAKLKKSRFPRDLGIDWQLWNLEKPVDRLNPDQTREYDFVWKIHLVGDSGVGKIWLGLTNRTGKSCLLLRFMDNVYSDNYIATIGVDFKIRTVGIERSIAKLQVWDVMLNSRVVNYNINYMRRTHGFVITFDLTDKVSFNNVKQWYQELDRRVITDPEKTAVLVVGTKADLFEKRVVAYEEAKEFCDTYSFEYIETSAKTGYNVEPAFYRLVKSIYEKLDPEESFRKANQPSVNFALKKPQKKTDCIVS